MANRVLIVVRVDGGICSQIAFVAFGLSLQKHLGHSVEVKFDLGWYEEFGFDGDGRFVRNWDFDKAFPGIKLGFATKEEVEHLKRHHLLNADDLSYRDIPAAPAYICGYPERTSTVAKLAPLLASEFNPTVDEATRSVMEGMRQGNFCAVHVRRGDLSRFSSACGYPTGLEYYERATSIVKGLCPDVHFLLFSDEPDYVRGNIVPLLPKGSPYAISDNGSDKGFVDLFVMAQCKYVVSSIGSLGVYAAYLSRGDAVLLSSRCRQEEFAYLPNVIYLNDDRKFLLEQKKDACILNGEDGGITIREASLRAKIRRLRRERLWLVLALLASVGLGLFLAGAAWMFAK